MCANQQPTLPSAAMISRTPATDALDRPHKRRRSTGSFDSNSSRCTATTNGSTASGSLASSACSSTFDLAAVFASISSSDGEEAFPSIGWDDDDDEADVDGCPPLPEATTPLTMISNKRELSGLQRTKACRSLPALPTFR